MKELILRAKSDQKAYRRLADQLARLKVQIDREDLPVPLNEEQALSHQASIDFIIELLVDCNVALEDHITDLESEG